MTAFDLKDLILMVSCACVRADAREKGTTGYAGAEIEKRAFLIASRLALPTCGLQPLAVYVGRFLAAYPDGVGFEHENAINEDSLNRICPEKEDTFRPQEVEHIASVFARLIDYRIGENVHHSERIAARCGAMARYYHWDPDHGEQFVLAGALHDVGKILISHALMDKPRSLSSNEYSIIKKHAYYSSAILRPVRGFDTVAAWAYRHHEKIDGSGYPYGLTGDQLSLEERLLACVDIYEALTESRSYKDPLSHEEAVSILHQLAEEGRIDGKLAEDVDRCFAVQE